MSAAFELEIPDLLPSVPTELTPSRTLDQWAEVVRADLARAVEGMIAAGEHLREARAQHPGTFRSWLDRKAAGIGRMTAYRLMKVAEAFSSCPNLGQLPPDRTALYDLARLEPAELQAAIGSGEVNPGMSRADAHRIVEMTEHRRRREQGLVEPAPRATDPSAPVPTLPESLLRAEALAPDDDFDDPIVRAECMRIAASPDEHFELAIGAARDEGDLSRQNVIRHLELLEGGDSGVNRVQEKVLALLVGARARPPEAAKLANLPHAEKVELAAELDELIGAAMRIVQELTGDHSEWDGRYMTATQFAVQGLMHTYNGGDPLDPEQLPADGRVTLVAEFHRKMMLLFEAAVANIEALRSWEETSPEWQDALARQGHSAGDGSDTDPSQQ